MPRSRASTDPWDEEGLDPEGPSAEDLDRFGDEFIACPHCGRQTYDQVELCPYCGMAIERGPGKSPVLFAVIGIVLVTIIAVGWMVF